MKEVSTNPEERFTLSQNARHITERFSKEKVYKMWDEVILKEVL